MEGGSPRRGPFLGPTAPGATLYGEKVGISSYRFPPQEKSVMNFTTAPPDSFVKISAVVEQSKWQ